jgi:hypothetical protein
MRNWGVWILVSLLCVATAVAVGPAVWRSLTGPPAGHCPFCLRAEHADMAVVVEVEGEGRHDACCVSCALSYRRQTGKRVRIVSVTDHDTGKVIDPAGAIFVVGSDVPSCQHQTVLLGEQKSVDDVRWDRCMPSILAFGARERAETFQAKHGGALRTLTELTDAANGSSHAAEKG